MNAEEVRSSFIGEVMEQYRKLKSGNMQIVSGLSDDAVFQLAITAVKEGRDESRHYELQGNLGSMAGMM